MDVGSWSELNSYFSSPDYDGQPFPLDVGMSLHSYEELMMMCKARGNYDEARPVFQEQQFRALQDRFHHPNDKEQWVLNISYMATFRELMRMCTEPMQKKYRDAAMYVMGLCFPKCFVMDRIAEMAAGDGRGNHVNEKLRSL